MKKALVTGIFGQDGSFLYELLNKYEYKVYGITNKNLSSNSIRIKDELSKSGKNPVVYHEDLQKYERIKDIIEDIQPDEIYHLAASHVSSEGRRNGKVTNEIQLFKNNLLGICNEISKNIRILTAGSCLMFDSSNTNRQDENTPYSSGSLYGIGKITENKLVEYYRNKGLYACTAILYNHESHRRSEDFVTRKIVRNMCMLKRNSNHKFSLGNIEIKKDWGYAKDYVKGMHLMLQADNPQDYILSSNELHSVREFIEICARILQIDNWAANIDINTDIINRNNFTSLYGDSKKIERELGWKRETGFEEMILKMVMEEMKYI